MSEMRFNEFEREEYERRYTKVRALMKERGIDALLLFSDVNLRYLGGVVNCYWLATMRDDVQCLLVTEKGAGDTALMQPDHLAHGASGSSWTRRSKTRPIRFRLLRRLAWSVRAKSSKVNTPVMPGSCSGPVS